MLYREEREARAKARKDWEEGEEEEEEDDNLPLGQEYWQQLQTKKDYSNYLRRLKRKLKKEFKLDKIFKASQKKAKDYYIFQKQQQLSYTKHALLQLPSSYKPFLLHKQKDDYFSFSKNLQEERYYVSLLYEDYILPLRGRNRIKIDPMLHENRYKKRFLTQLHKQQYYASYYFTKKQRCERMLHFLWCLLNFKLFSQEKDKLRLFQSPRTFSFYPSSSTCAPRTFPFYSRPSSSGTPQSSRPLHNRKSHKQLT